MDRTGRIIRELQKMVEHESYAPALREQIVSLIEGVNSRDINLFDYRRHNSAERFGKDIVDIIAEADRRQQQQTSI